MEGISQEAFSARISQLASNLSNRIGTLEVDKALLQVDLNDTLRELEETKKQLEELTKVAE